MRYLKVENKEDLIRDMESKAILNTDKSSLNSFLNQRNKILEQKRRENLNDQRLSQLENDMGEIKELLKELLRSNNGN